MRKKEHPGRSLPGCSFYVLSQFSAVLGAEFIRAICALERGIAVFPEALRMQKHIHFPHQQCDDGSHQQAEGIK
jgi:hypothetical protein